jgi:hypothetical protein
MILQSVSFISLIYYDANDPHIYCDLMILSAQRGRVHRDGHKRAPLRLRAKEGTANSREVVRIKFLAVFILLSAKHNCACAT